MAEGEYSPLKSGRLVDGDAPTWECDAAGVDDYIDPRDSLRAEGYNAVPLKSLEEFNADRCRNWEEAHKPRPNGIACPECGAELMDTFPNGLRLPCFQRPSMRTIHCPECGYCGERVA